MNQGGGVRSSPPVQQIANGRGPNWCRFPAAIPPSVNIAPPWSDGQDIPQSWRNLLIGGLVEEEDAKCGLLHMESEELETWEQHLLNQDSSTHENSCLEVKQESFCWLPPPPYQMIPSSSVANFSSNMREFSAKTTDPKHPKQHSSSHNKCDDIGAAATGIMSKRPRIQASSCQSSFKVRKEKLGDRITALHQIVSPFGKTDTASVLLEAMGYIRFLQAQIQALSLPYMGSRTPSITTGRQDTECVEGGAKDLKSRGLCLVPISCTVQVGSETNGADYWAPPLESNFS